MHAAERTVKTVVCQRDEEKPEIERHSEIERKCDKKRESVREKEREGDRESERKRGGREGGNLLGSKPLLITVVILFWTVALAQSICS